MKYSTMVLAVFLMSLVTAAAGIAGDHAVRHKNGIVLAMFGTTVEPALQGLLNIKERLETKYPATPVRIAFTSNIIRRIWQKRSADPEYLAKHPNIPPEILHVQGPLATIANFQDQGFDTLVVQPTHIAPAEEYLDLQAYVEALASIETVKARFKPFHRLVIGRPLLGTYGPGHPYESDIRAAVQAMAADVALARKEGAALVYMGHGNEFFPSGGSYLEFEYQMQQTYPDVPCLVGTVEGFPSFERLLARLQQLEIKKVVIKPFMVVAGDHARNDMAGPEPDSWKSRLQKAGLTVIPVLHGLGENNAVADIFVQHALDAAADAGITLQ